MEIDPAALKALSDKIVSSSSNAAVSLPPGHDAFDDILKLSTLKESSKGQLVDILSALRGRKALLLDPQLAGLVNNIFLPEGVKVLKEYGVVVLRELRGLYAGEGARPGSSDSGVSGGGVGVSDLIADLDKDSIDNIVYLVRPYLPLLKIVAKQVAASVKAGIRTQFHIYFVPNRTTVCEQLLEDEGILEHVYIGEFQMGFVPIEKDILTLEMDGIFKQCYVDGDTSSLNTVARALNQFQNNYGTIPNLKCKGAASKKVLQKMLDMKMESAAEWAENGGLKRHNSSSDVIGGGAAGGGGGKSDDGSSMFSDIDTLVIFDREIDLVTVMATPLIYEGLVDELVGIDNAKIRVDASIIGEEKDDLDNKSSSSSSSSNKQSSAAAASGKPKPNEKTTLYLNNTDTIFSEIRDTSIERLGTYLQEKALKIKTVYANFRDTKSSIEDVRSFVKKIPDITREYKSLHRHINIAEFIKSKTDLREFRDMWQGERGMLEGEPFVDQIEEMIYADVERTQLYRILRLLCIQSLTSNGIKTSKYETIKRLIIQTYGFDELVSLSHLEKVGMLKKKDVVLIESTSIWSGLRKQLRLIDDGTNPYDANLASVAAGFIPMLPRLVQEMVSKGWSNCQEIMKLLPGALLEVQQSTVHSSGKVHVSAADNSLDGDSSSSSSSSSSGGGGGGQKNQHNKKAMMIMVVGGLTYMEISAFRFLSKEPTFPYRIILATTKIINGTSLIRSLRSNPRDI